MTHVKCLCCVTLNSSADDVETLLPELEDIAESSPSSSSTSSPEPAERLHDFGELEYAGMGWSTLLYLVGL